MTGYAHPLYADSLSEFGSPQALPRSGGWILKRSIPDSPYDDAMGCYPLFACGDWSQLEADIDALGDELVSLAIVADPFGDYDERLLRSCFPDHVMPFKEHLIIDLQQAMFTYVSSHHRRNARKALNQVSVELCRDPRQLREEWPLLYAELAQRHRLQGIQAFSGQALTRQLSLPELVAFRAMHDGCVVGITLWIVQGDVVYYHLGASTDLGYRLRASFALFWRAIEFFTDSGRCWIDLGAGAGLQHRGNDGLVRFKSGWATGTRHVYFCGRVLNETLYRETVHVTGTTQSSYFPAYRSGEFG